MNQITIAQTEKKIEKPINLSWKDNPAVQKLLDVVASILAEEYIQIAKENPEVFTPHPNPLPSRERESNGGSK